MTGIRRDSYRNPDGVRQDSGYGNRSSSNRNASSRAGGNGVPIHTGDFETDYPNTARRLRWVDKAFPGIDPRWRGPLASAVSTINRGGRKVTRASVLARVRDQWGEEFCREEGLPK